MAKIKSITLKNFKGVGSVTIDLANRISTPVITLIGLNESGKTTILEGLSHFVTRDDDVLNLFDELSLSAEMTSLIPLQKGAAFTGTIGISAAVIPEKDDLERAVERARSHKLQLDKEHFLKEFVVETRYIFEDSVLKESEVDWDFEVRGRTSKGKEKVIEGPLAEDSDRPDLWSDISNDMQEGLPRIAYFPTFLVEMPERIYLKAYDDEPATNRFYRNVFQDVLDSLNEGLSLDRHVCKRIDAFKAHKNNPSWVSLIFGAPDKKPIDAVFQKISSVVTKQVLGSWKRVFQRRISANSITVTWNIDTENDDLPYASFYVSDGESKYSISDRSLGFRWFFSFLLFTAFKQATKRPTLFLFDEPAANLHAKAQAELLTSFAKIVEDGNQIVYSTHSHHMINPEWLSGAYIVENTALDYDAPDQFGLNAKPTNIVATRYRNFVSQNPERSSYFQPVLEKLEYVTPAIVGSPPFVLVEGILDFRMFRLMQKFMPRKQVFSFLPGVGATTLGPQINLLLGRGERFVILLDADRAGKQAAKHYQEKWLLPPEEVLTLADVDKKYDGMMLEDLLGDVTLRKVKEHFGLASQPTKKQIGLYVTEMSATGANSDCLGAEARKSIGAVIDFLASKL